MKATNERNEIQSRLDSLKTIVEGKSSELNESASGMSQLDDKLTNV